MQKKARGWSEEETRTLFFEACAAQEKGGSMREVFSDISKRFGRKRDSVRNHYYSQLKRSEELPSSVSAEVRQVEKTRFRPFEEEEVAKFLRVILDNCVKGISVRKSVLLLSGGDETLMLRYQNKFRNCVKTRSPILLRVIAEQKQAGCWFDPFAHKVCFSGAPQELTVSEVLDVMDENELVEVFVEIGKRLFVPARTTLKDALIAFEKEQAQAREEKQAYLN